MIELGGPIELAQIRLQPESAVERAIVEGDVAARTRAAARLVGAFGGFDLVVASRATDDAVMSLAHVSPAVLEAMALECTADRYLTSHEARDGNFAQASEGAGAVPASPRVRVEPYGNDHLERALVRPGAMHRALRAGETFVINRVDQFDTGALRSVAEDIEHTLGVHVSVNCYISREGATGFGAHWDDHDVLILQVGGRKMWEVFQPGYLSPERHFVDDGACGSSAWSGVLAAGDCVFIPRGWPHRVVGLEELSVHYTFGLSGSTFRNVVASLGRPASHLDRTEFRSWLSASTKDGYTAAARVLGNERAQIPTRSRGSLLELDAWQARGSKPDELRLLMPGGAVFHGPPPSAGGVRLAWAGSLFEFDAAESRSLADAPEDRADGEDLWQALLERGLARVAAT